MPKRTDISSILIIGSGPIVIGQACEFDYAGAQACKALRQEGYQVILANSNPATIMTDPNFSDVTYIEPLNIEVLEKIIEQEKPDTLLPTLGGQTGLNLSLQLHEKGILKKHQVEMIGACPESINCGENRELFRSLMLKIGEQLPQSGVATTLEAAYQVADLIGKFPLIIRPSFTLGGLGGGIAYNREEFQKLCVTGLEASLSSQILVEEGLVGWKEYEMEVMRDHKDQCVLICSIENIDPMGIHTGDSITVAPAMTLSNSDYQAMREASFRIMRAVGVETGGSNIQFAINPQTGRRVVIEMNPRVSRSSALASKATGFPIAKIAAKLAVGYALEELPNDITKKTPASFEPSLDYVVTKIPRFAFEKFRGSTQALGSSMRSVGETMALGSNFKESFQKAIRGLELGVDGFCALNLKNVGQTQLREALARPTHQRLFFLAHALKEGMEVEVIASLTHIDPWFIYQFKEIVEEKKHLESLSWEELDLPTLKRAKAMGFGDSELASIWNCEVKQLAQRREAWGLRRHFCEVDTCAGEFAAHTPYYYSTWNAPFVRKQAKNLGS